MQQHSILLRNDKLHQWHQPIFFGCATIVHNHALMQHCVSVPRPLTWFVRCGALCRWPAARAPGWGSARLAARAWPRWCSARWSRCAGAAGGCWSFHRTWRSSGSPGEHEEFYHSNPVFVGLAGPVHIGVKLWPWDIFYAYFFNFLTSPHPKKVFWFIRKGVML